MKERKDKNKVRTVFFIIFIAVTIILTIVLIPVIKLIMTPEGRALLKVKVESFGAFGPVAFLAIQIIQVVVALIPGEPIEILGGVLFGGIGGFLLCMIGNIIGMITVFYIVRGLGKSFVQKVVDSKAMSKLKIMNDEKKLELLVFVLFLIPGTPKDSFTYLVPLTRINPVKYFIYASIARIPSVISSTILGDSIVGGKLVLSIVILVITGAIGVLGIMFNDKIVGKIHNEHK